VALGQRAQAVAQTIAIEGNRLVEWKKSVQAKPRSQVVKIFFNSFPACTYERFRQPAHTPFQD
jgi:hypothetical protein